MLQETLGEFEKNVQKIRAYFSTLAMSLEPLHLLFI